ncbi:MAG TPA: aminodeoxychorismate/anthranilate synthase component II [Gammaproteobacteria bacterium]|nr:aminodeoxychorismate/anthranilate synthase component II [Gammaproteobacteria bacterium]
MILIIDNYDSFTYNLYQSVAQMHSNVKVYRNNKITVSEINTLNPSGIILSPGPGRPEDAGICVELIQNLNSTIPLLGVCLGLQAIMIAFGGKVIKSHEIIHGKSDFIFHNQNNIYKNLPKPFEAGRYHSLIAERSTLPDELIIDAENKDKTIMGLRHKTKPIYGVQFHPESILTPQGNQLLQDFVYELKN